MRHFSLVFAWATFLHTLPLFAGELVSPSEKVPKAFEMPFVASTPAEARKWQEQARAKLLELVAVQAPRRSAQEIPPDFQVVSAEDRGEYTLQHGSFCGNDGNRRPCLVAIPRGEEKLPAMLCLHGHGGSAEMVFDPKSIYRGFADHFARGGYVVIAPTLEHREYAATALWDLMRCVDILTQRGEVDAQRIGAAGLSMGGEWTMWIAACDERIKAAVVSGWMCTTAGVFAVPNCPCWELPGFVPVMDVCETHLLIAPRPVLFENAEADESFPLKYTFEGFQRIQRGYRVFGAEAAVAQDVFPGGHAWHGPAAYVWIDKHLGGKAASRYRNAQQP
ncbi:MAG: acetylxylan esterase [Planctomycetes bacterium]|nr:acetylxylan esterase [Planctomycetota bacterium]